MKQADGSRGLILNTDRFCQPNQVKQTTELKETTLNTVTKFCELIMQYFEKSPMQLFGGGFSDTYQGVSNGEDKTSAQQT